jgi:hypothetical protein
MSKDDYQGSDGHPIEDVDVMPARFAGSYFDENGKFVRLYWGERDV